MADAQLKLSRRALLAAVCALPVLSEVEAPFIPSTSFPRKRESSGCPDQPEKGLDPRFRGDDALWANALARLRRAEAALNAVVGTDDDDLYDRLLGRLNKAMKRLLTLPAPNLPALADKLDLLVEHQAWELRFAEPALTAIRSDARRLAARSS
jgi:hypothetical protein